MNQEEDMATYGDHTALRLLAHGVLKETDISYLVKQEEHIKGE